ncbi:hypothetical protein EG327_003074 [Venturia inaequalis]|uniref:Photolyase/cryptochrome alpha/beta domain-containing protein n=1 Tax=Venturia inaequalis TaxID=5025 RepID=A0A8H3VR28_VENIN|nr:hypothetical protein EG327_003074 [Venturia inaequalis]
MSKRELPAEKIHPSTKRAKQIDANPPYEELKSLIENEGKKELGTGGKNVIHWFRNQDLRIHDNKALHAASQFAKEHGKNLICIYIYCLKEIEWHGVGSARLDFLLRNFECLKLELGKLDIPFVMLDVEKRGGIVSKLAGFVEEYNVERVFANIEYEIDEVRRDITVMETAGEGNWSFELHHDQTIMEPGMLTTGAGKPMKIFTPYHNAWLQEIKAEPSLLDTVPAPDKNGKSARKELSDLFNTNIPEAPKEKTMAKDERDRIRKLWPAGHDEAEKRMRAFISKNLSDYAATRSNPAEDSTSRMSAYFNAGIYSMREALQEIKKYNKGSTDFTSGSKNGVYAWVREIVFRELRGERYFAETLVDWDLSNNTQGWEPSYTVFNPVNQAEKNDPNGDYIRRWVPELKNVKGKAVFDPFHRLSKEEFGKLGYPEPYVDWKETKARCLERYKRDMKDAEP